MAFVPAPNIIMGEARCTLAGQKCENRFMFNNGGPVGASELQFVATTLWNWWELTYASVLPTQTALVEVVATDMSVLNGEQYTYAPDATTTGNVASAVLPNECSMCVSLRTGNRGRSARGRFYTVGVPVAARVDDNNVSVSYAGDLATAGQALITAFAASLPLTIVSYRSEGIPRPGGPVYFPVTTALVVDRLIDSMRRRKPGVGT